MPRSIYPQRTRCLRARLFIPITKGTLDLSIKTGFEETIHLAYNSCSEEFLTSLNIYDVRAISTSWSCQQCFFSGSLNQQVSGELQIFHYSLP